MKTVQIRQWYIFGTKQKALHWSALRKGQRVRTKQGSILYNHGHPCSCSQKLSCWADTKRKNTHCHANTHHFTFQQSKKTTCHFITSSCSSTEAKFANKIYRQNLLRSKFHWRHVLLPCSHCPLTFWVVVPQKLLLMKTKHSFNWYSQQKQMSSIFSTTLVYLLASSWASLGSSKLTTHTGRFCHISSVAFFSVDWSLFLIMIMIFWLKVTGKELCLTHA